ncbi:MAG: hypothetical protein IJL63_00320 [Clostridia bacterium]|nr:hypothetical protein [Clostridia bacterium]
METKENKTTLHSVLHPETASFRESCDSEDTPLREALLSDGAFSAEHGHKTGSDFSKQAPASDR